MSILNRMWERADQLVRRGSDADDPVEAIACLNEAVILMHRAQAIHRWRDTERHINFTQTSRNVCASQQLFD